MQRYEKYKNSEIDWLGQIPEHWGVESFKNILNERNEKNDPIRSKERLSLSIDKGVTLYDEKTTNLDRFKDDFTQYKIACQGDLVFNSMNMIVGAVGVSDYYGCVSPVYYTYHSTVNPYSTKFYEYLFKSQLLRGVLYSLGKGLIAIDRGEGKYNTLRLKVSRDDLRGLKIPFPIFAEQEQIVKFLNEKCEKIDSVVNIKEQQIEKLKELRQITIHNAITQGISHCKGEAVHMKDSGIDWIGEMPGHWELKRLKHLMKINNGLDYKHVQADEGYPVIGSGGQFAFASKYLYDGEVLFLGRKGTIDKPLYFNGKFWTVDTMFFCIANSKGNTKYLYYVATTIPFKYYSTATALPSLTQSDLNNHKITIPPLSEQEEIVSYLDEQTSKIDKAIAQKQEQIVKLKEYKQSLINEVVTGKLKVVD